MRSNPEAIIQIKSGYNNFNSTEQRIAQYIIDNPSLVVHSTISQVAEVLGVADATIFRFCKKNGFKGFQDLKIRLATELSDGIRSYANEQISADDSQKSIVEKVFKANITALSDTLASLSAEKMELAVDIILSSNRIVFYGNGGSGAVATDAHHKFLRTGLNVCSYTDNHMQLMSAAQLGKDDAVIVISHTGSNLDMMRLLDIARANGTKSIGITSFLKSPVSDRVDVLLNAVSQETEYQFEAFASRIAHLSIIDALYISTSLKRKDLTHEAVLKMREAISITRI